MKSILCYGDSLSWGMNAATLGRHAHADLWPTVLGRRLGEGVVVVNASLGGRTTMFDDHAAATDRNGVRLLPTVLGMHEPLDLVIFLLGTNDLKPFINGSAVGAAQGIKRLCEIVRTFPYGGGAAAPAVLIVAPPEPLDLGPNPRFPLLSPRSNEWSGLAPAYRQVARDVGAEFFDAAGVATARDGGDGVHLDAANTRAIGEALAPVVARMLSLTEASAP
jgi:lysophospholipase L1-like esterase